MTMLWECIQRCLLIGLYEVLATFLFRHLSQKHQLVHRAGRQDGKVVQRMGSGLDSLSLTFSSSVYYLHDYGQVA